ncbi:MAG: DUF6483 family protein [Oscillospiraceae bacterium]
MIFQEDFFMRQIEQTARVVGQFIFGKESLTYEIFDEENLSQTDVLSLNIENLIKAGKISDAQEMLTNNLDYNNIDDLVLALNFYQTLNKISDKTLEKYGTNREELYDSMKSILRRYNVAEELL